MAFKITFLKSKVARRIFALFVICALLPIITFAALSFRQVTKQLEEQSKRRLHNVTRSVGMGIFERLLFLETEIKIVSSFYTSEHRADRHPSIEIFGDRLAQKFYGIGVTNSVGDYTPLFGHIENLPKLTESEMKHLSVGKVLLSTQHLEKDSERIFMCKILDQKQETQKILQAEIKPNYIWGVSDEGVDTLPSMTELCVLDQSNGMLYSSIPTLASLPEQILSDVSLDHAGTFEWKHQGREYIASHWSVFLKPVFHLSNWTVVLNESKEEVLAPITLFKRTFPHVALLSLVIVFLASFIQIRRSLFPIEILKKGTKRVSEGDFNTKVKISSGDEFEALGNSFNEMSKKIKDGQALLVQTAKMGAIGQMAAGIVHEINQPMTSIFGLLDLCLMAEVSEDQKNRLERLKKAVKRLMEIVTKFRSFSRLSGEKMVPLSINQVIDEAYSLLEHQIQMKKVNCIIEKSEDLPLVSGDNNSLQQVFTNFIINAVDALESKQNGDAQVKIMTYRCDDKVCVDVKDNGAGIPKDIQKQIFDPFFTTKSVEKGTGLGLAITQDILHNHKAQIKVESQEGIGTRFIVSFPT